MKELAWNKHLNVNKVMRFLELNTSEQSLLAMIWRFFMIKLLYICSKALYS